MHRPVGGAAAGVLSPFLSSLRVLVARACYINGAFFQPRGHFNQVFLSLFFFDTTKKARIKDVPHLSMNAECCSMIMNYLLSLKRVVYF